MIPAVGRKFNIGHMLKLPFPFQGVPPLMGNNNKAIDSLHVKSFAVFTFCKPQFRGRNLRARPSGTGSNSTPKTWPMALSAWRWKSRPNAGRPRRRKVKNGHLTDPRASLTLTTRSAPKGAPQPSAATPLTGRRTG